MKVAFLLSIVSFIVTQAYASEAAKTLALPNSAMHLIDQTHRLHKLQALPPEKNNGLHQVELMFAGDTEDEDLIFRSRPFSNDRQASNFIKKIYSELQQAPMPLVVRLDRSGYLSSIEPKFSKDKERADYLANQLSAKKREIKSLKDRLEAKNEIIDNLNARLQTCGNTKPEVAKGTTHKLPGPYSGVELPAELGRSIIEAE